MRPGVAHPQRNDDNERRRNDGRQRLVIRHVVTVVTQSTVERSIWNEEEYQRRDDALGDALREHFLVEQHVQLTRSIQLRIS